MILTKMFYLIMFIIIFTTKINSIAIDDFHCKVPACRDFFYGLINHPKRDVYVDICYDTVFALQSIPHQFGKCVIQDADNGYQKKFNAKCIQALAATIKRCIFELKDLTDDERKHYCSSTIMKYCAVHVGLEMHPLKQFDTNLSRGKRTLLIN